MTEQTLKHIPSVLRDLDWQPMEESLQWYDGDELLVAVPVNDRRWDTHRDGGEEGDSWHYEFSVIRISCDSESPLSVEAEGGCWGWDLDDVDWWVRIK